MFVNCEYAVNRELRRLGNTRCIHKVWSIRDFLLPAMYVHKVWYEGAIYICIYVHMHAMIAVVQLNTSYILLFYTLAKCKVIHTKLLGSTSMLLDLMVSFT